VRNATREAFDVDIGIRSSSENAFSSYCSSEISESSASSSSSDVEEDSTDEPTLVEIVPVEQRDKFGIILRSIDGIGIAEEELLLAIVEVGGIG
jgi:hypothetical protein